MWNEIVTKFVSEMHPRMWEMVAQSTWETIYMGLAATAIAVLVGLPMGFLAFLTDKGRILENRSAFVILDVIINIGRSVPFIILLIILMPVTRFLVGTTLGTTAAIVPLSVAAIPFLHA